MLNFHNEIIISVSYLNDRRLLLYILLFKKKKIISSYYIDE